MKKKIKIYALSTCIWCQKTIKYFKNKGVPFEYVFVDELEGDEYDAVNEEIAAVNPEISFPTVCIDDKVIVGYKVDEFEACLKEK
jgi:glutaredoxin-like protein NrdH